MREEDLQEKEAQDARDAAANLGAEGPQEDKTRESPSSGQPQGAQETGGQPQPGGSRPERGHSGRRRRGRGGDRDRGGDRERGERSGERDRGEDNHRHRGQGGERRERGAQSAPRPLKKVKREILASVGVEETRIAIVEDGRLAELLWGRKRSESIVGNIYKGEVENVLPGISSAFVNIGFDKNAYLYISDVLGARGNNIDSILKKGQHIMIQVAKESIGTKGMKVTMDVSLPGRYLVFSPMGSAVGVSKHIIDAEERKRLSSAVESLSAKYLESKGGLVIRTEAEGATEADLEREVKYLAGMWAAVQKKFETLPAPALLHKDLDLTLQVARDIFSDETEVYLVDDKEIFNGVSEFVNEISPELKDRVRLYEGKTPIFKAFNLESELENLRQIKVALPSGGSIVIQEAESLCAIDVNTGRFTGSRSQEETVTQTNVEAAHEIAHQLRLRNIGGIIVVDFIDMRKASNRNRVMDSFAQFLKRDRAKIRILPITRLGLIEMTRERKRESTVSFLTSECPQCKGAGRVLSGETMRIRIQREIFNLTRGRPGGQARIMVHPALAETLRGDQALLEKNVQRSVRIQGDPTIPWEDYRIIIE
ncbi:MAG TPA: Rne/Rng family ribonuclease [Elusimicrobiota bacterium]|nr:Rne/Rng family ribonuclease [Elusimicrobiota bacterium]